MGTVAVSRVLLCCQRVLNITVLLFCTVATVRQKLMELISPKTLCFIYYIISSETGGCCCGIAAIVHALCVFSLCKSDPTQTLTLSRILTNMIKLELFTSVMSKRWLVIFKSASASMTFRRLKKHEVFWYVEWSVTRDIHEEQMKKIQA